jgi:hypothetical protein
MRLAALIPRGRNGGGLGFPIRFLFAEDPVGGFGQMPGHRTDGLGVASVPGDALVETTDVTVRGTSAPDADRVGRFDESPYLKALRRPSPSAPPVEELRFVGFRGIPR